MMKRSILLLLLFPLFSTAQNGQPHFDNDTLYTSGGYRVYKGQVLQLANGSSEAGYFRFIRFAQSMGRTDTYILQNSSIRVSKLRNFKGSSSGNYSIRLSGTATLNNKTTAEIDITLDFEKAIESFDGIASEMIVPDEFRPKKPAGVSAAAPKQVTAPVTETKKETVTEDPKKQTDAADIKKLLIADEIKKLFDLYKAGALTKEEYEARKKKLLEQ